MIVVTGFGWSDFSYETSRNTEIIDLEDPSFVCSNVDKYPTQMGKGTGGLTRGIPFVCGGWNGWDSGEVFNSCYSLHENGEWIEDQSTTLTTARGAAAYGSVVMGDRLVLAGGYSSYPSNLRPNRDDIFETIEMASPNHKSTTLPVELPVALAASCVVQWDSNTFMLIGGASGRRHEKETYFINVKSNIITAGPSLNKRRAYHACQEIVVNDASYIVVTGGLGTEMSTEILAKSSMTNNWEYGKMLSSLLHVSTMD